MVGTKAGGMKAAVTNKKKYGDQFYANIGRKGGQNGHTGGFAANPALAKIAGRKGGQISRRGKAKPKTTEQFVGVATKAEADRLNRAVAELEATQKADDRRKSIKLWYRLFGRHK